MLAHFTKRKCLYFRRRLSSYVFNLRVDESENT